MALFAKGNIRNAFLSSFACDSTLAQAGPLPAADTTPIAKPVISLASTKVYPNPVQSVLTVDCKAATNTAIKTMRIYNSIGVNIFSAQLSQEITKHNLSGLTSGIYYIEVAGDKDKFTTKVIKL